MSPRNCGKKCAKKRQHITVITPRPCVDSLHIPYDFFLPPNYFLPPPYYHSSVIRHEHICECPESPVGSSHSSLNCEASNELPVNKKHASTWSDSCHSHDYDATIRSQNGARKFSHEQSETLSRKYQNNHSNSYQNIPGAHKRSGYTNEESIKPSCCAAERGSNQHKRATSNHGNNPNKINAVHTGTLNKSNMTEVSNRFNNFEEPPPRYMDSVDGSPPDYTFNSSCCDSGGRLELQSLSNKNATVNRDSVKDSDNAPTQRIPMRYHFTPEAIRKHALSSDQNAQTSFKFEQPSGMQNTSRSLIDFSRPSTGTQSGPSCCNNAVGRKRNDDLPAKGMSGANRPGFLKDDTTNALIGKTEQCMSSSGSGCSRGISSIMPRLSSYVAPETPLSEGLTYSRKDPTGKIMKPTRKQNCRREAGTDVCDSITCLANQNKYCTCIYPPAFKQFSCTGNITGACNCAQRFL